MPLGSINPENIIKASPPAIIHRELIKPTELKRALPIKKPTPFKAFLEPVSTATHLNKED